MQSMPISFADRPLPNREIPGEPEVRAQLRRILASPDFAASPRNRRFLEHVVEQTLRGRRVKGYEVGTKVFGRGPEFNATSDPIVRIEAGKLRRDLEMYYLKSGRMDPVRIALAKGAYRAILTYRKDGSAPDPWPAISRSILRTALLGLAGKEGESGAAWSALQREYPDLLLDPRIHTALEKIHGHDERVRELMLEGLRRAARPVELSSPQPVSFVRHA